MIVFTEQQVRAALGMDSAIECLRAAFTDLDAGRAQNQPRRRLFLDSGAVLHSLAGSYGRYFGTKIYSTHPRHGAHFTVLLYDADTAKPLAQFEANHLGQIRTGAATGLAVDVLRGPGPISVAIIGSGFQAQTQLAAVRAVRDVRQARIWSRDPGRRERFAREHQAVAAASARAAVESADVIITVTSSKDQVLETRWVQDNALVCAVGSNYPTRRELPPDLVRTAGRIVADSREQARIEAGDLVLALDEAGWTRVEDLSAAVASPRVQPGVTIFKSVGLGLEDVAAAAFIYERARL